MKMLKVSPLFAVAIAGALVFGPVAYGQDTSGTNSNVTTPSGPPPGGGHHHGDRLAMLTEKLGLTEAQQEQIKPILKSEFEQMKALKDDTTTPKDEKREKFKSIHQAAEEQINAILTPEQLQKMKDWREEHRGKHGPGAGGPAGGPAPVTTGTTP